MRALLVDDERLARVGLRRLLRGHSDVVIVGEAANFDEASAQIHRLHPDLLFLDVEMPGCSGLQLLSELEESPLVIFTTAYENYALRAFGVGAIDYLLKPIAAERLGIALTRARRLIEPKAAETGYSRRFLLRHGDQCWIVPASKIRLLKSEGNYTRVHFGDNFAMISKSLNALQARLDPKVFFRVNRSHIINLQDVKVIHPQADGTFLATLADGLQVVISRRQASHLGQVFKL